MLDADAWVVIKVKREADAEPYFKLLRGSYGGYTGSDTWNLNSGIDDYSVDAEIVTFTSASGSIYRVHKEQERMTLLMDSVVSNVKSMIKERGQTDIFEVIDFEEFQKVFDKQ